MQELARQRRERSERFAEGDVARSGRIANGEAHFAQQNEGCPTRSANSVLVLPAAGFVEEAAITLRDLRCSPDRAGRRGIPMPGNPRVLHTGPVPVPRNPNGLGGRSGRSILANRRRRRTADDDTTRRRFGLVHHARRRRQQRCRDQQHRDDWTTPQHHRENPQPHAPTWHLLRAKQATCFPRADVS